MKTKNYLLAISGIVILLGSFLLSVPKGGQAQSRNQLPVTVENTPNNPVPVTIGNRVRTCPDENCPASMLNANDRNAFQKRVQFVIADGVPLTGVSILVPEGKRLVIEFVTASQLAFSQPVAIRLRTLVNGAQSEFSLLQVKQAEPNIDLWITTQQMRVYADAPSFRIEAGRQTPFVADSAVDVDWRLFRAATPRLRRTEFSLLGPVGRYRQADPESVAERMAPLGDASSVKGSGTPGRIPKWLDSRTIGDSVITELNGNIGIGTTTPGSKLTLEGATAPAGAVFRANNTGTAGAGVLANGGNNSGGEGGVGVRAVGGDSTGGGLNFGGRGVIANGGFSNSGEGGRGVVAVGGDSSSGSGGDGVLANGGFSNGPGGDGVRSFAGSSTGSFGGDGVLAVGGTGSGAGHRGGDGIIAEAGLGFEGATNGLAGNFNGNVDVSGTLTKGGGSFKIDHPLDPANKYLSHSFVESPDMLNIYNGNVTTDDNGNATVSLPDYFAALNRDFRYQLTVIGQFAQAIVADEITNQRFTIKTDKPRVKVSWQVTGIRQDGWANKNRVPVEVQKPEGERGYYLHPEVFDQPDERSISWARHPDLMRQMKERREQINRQPISNNR